MTYSGWKGGEKYKTVAQVRAKHPEQLITHAVKGMIPKNRLGRVLMTKLKVYKGPKHTHAAQTPAALKAAKLIYCMATKTTNEFLGTGRRKTAIARVRLATGTGKITVNGRTFENYFPLETLRAMVSSSR